MKQILLSTGLLAMTCFAFSFCRNGTAAVSAAGAAATGSAATATAADASFSYVIEGRTISGSGVGNGANVATKKAGGLVHFILMSLDVTQKAPSQFLFQVADHGTTTITEDDMDRHRSGDGKYFADFSIPPLDPHNPIPDYDFGASITVTITSMSASHVAGSFSGTMVNPATKKKVPLTDGNLLCRCNDH